MPHNNMTPEFSRPVEVGKIPARGMEMSITANAKECTALARRLGVLELRSLAAGLELQHAESGMIAATGEFTAEAVQQCVVTLEPVPVRIRARLNGLFVPENSLPAEDDRAEITDILAEEPEPIVNGMIDLGELAVQHLALALDPYPRKPGAAVDFQPPSEEAERHQNPFSGLEKLIKNKKKQPDSG